MKITVGEGILWRGSPFGWGYTSFIFIPVINLSILADLLDQTYNHHGHNMLTSTTTSSHHDITLPSRVRVKELMEVEFKSHDHVHYFYVT